MTKRKWIVWVIIVVIAMLLWPWIQPYWAGAQSQQPMRVAFFYNGLNIQEYYEIQITERVEFPLFEQQPWMTDSQPELLYIVGGTVQGDADFQAVINGKTYEFGEDFLLAEGVYTFIVSHPGNTPSWALWPPNYKNFLPVIVVPEAQSTPETVQAYP